MLWKCCTQYASKFGKHNCDPRKRSVFLIIPNKGNAKECSNYCTIAFLSHTSKVMLKILQARFQQYVKLWIFRYWSWFYRRQRNQISNCQHPWNQWKSESSRKTSISALLTLPKPLTVWITINCGKFWKRWEYQTTGPASWQICMQVRKQQLELDVEQQTGSK